MICVSLVVCELHSFNTSHKRKKIELVFISLFVSQMKRCRFYNKLRVSYSLLLFQDEQHANGKESDVRIPKSTGCGANA